MRNRGTWWSYKWKSYMGTAEWKICHSQYFSIIFRTELSFIRINISAFPIWFPNDDFKIAEKPCKDIYIYIYILFTGWEVRITRNCARDLQSDCRMWRILPARKVGKKYISNIQHKNQEQLKCSQLLYHPLLFILL